MLARLRHHFPALASVGIRLVGVTIGFLIVIIVGRTWGPQGSGIYGLVSQTAMFLAIVAVGGLDLAAVRALAGIDPVRERLGGWAILRLLGITALFAAIPAIAILRFGDRAIALITDDALPATALAALIALLLARALARMMSAILRSQQYFLLGQAMEAVVIPLPFCLALLLVVGPAIDDLLRWITIMAIAAIAIGGAAILWLYLAARRADRSPQSPSLRAMIGTALPLWGVTIALNFAEWYGLTIITAQLGLAEAGIYRVVMQFALLFSVLSAGLTGVYSVRIAAAQSASDWPGVARQVRSFTWLSAALAILPALVMIVLARPLLGIVGPEFETGTAALQLGVIGQVIYLILAPAGLTLAMTGFARINLAITLASTAALVVLAPLSAAHFGLIGVVACISVLLIARNLLALLVVRRKLGINALSGRYHPPASPLPELADRKA